MRGFQIRGAVMLLLASLPLLWADDPTSRFVALSAIPTSLPASTSGNAVQFEIWNQASGGIQISTEGHTVDTDGSSNITNDTGFADLLLGRPGGLIPANYTPGESRYLDVTQGVSKLSARIPLYASPFTISPGPQGPPGPTGPQGIQGPPGPVASVTAGDGSIAVGGTTSNPTIAVAANGITNLQIANGALSPTKITGTAATLGSNSFVGDQNVSDGTVTVSSSNGVALDGLGAIVGVRGSAGAGGFGIVGSAPPNGTAGQFNGSVNVTANLTAAAMTTTSLNCTGCVKNTQLGVNYAGSASQGGPATNSLALGGVAASGYAPASGSPNYVFKSGDSMTGPLWVGGNLSAFTDMFVGNVTNPAFAGSRSIYFQNNGGDVQNSFRINAGAAGGSDNLFLVGYSGPGSTRGTGIKFLTAPATGGQVERMSIDPNGNVSVAGTLSAGTLLGAGLSGMKEFTNDANVPSANYTWTAPAGVTHVTVDMWSGGMGGGTNGGMGGTYSRSIVGVVPGTTYSIVVGGGGAGNVLYMYGDNGYTSSMSLGSVTLINAVSYLVGIVPNPSIAAISRGGYNTAGFSGNAAFGATFSLGPLGYNTGRGGDINVAGNAGYVLLTW